jgi:hypothetical protein
MDESAGVAELPAPNAEASRIVVSAGFCTPDLTPDAPLKRQFDVVEGKLTIEVRAGRVEIELEPNDGHR